MDKLVTEDILDTIFSRFGELADVTVKKHVRTTEPPSQSGYGFVYFIQRDAALRSLYVMKHTHLDGVTYDCSLSYRSEQQLKRSSPGPSFPSSSFSNTWPGPSPQQQQQQQHHFPRVNPRSSPPQMMPMSRAHQRPNHHSNFSGMSDIPQIPRNFFNPTSATLPNMSFVRPLSPPDHAFMQSMSMLMPPPPPPMDMTQVSYSNYHLYNNPGNSSLSMYSTGSMPQQQSLPPMIGGNPDPISSGYAQAMSNSQFSSIPSANLYSQMPRGYVDPMMYSSPSEQPQYFNPNNNNR